MQVLNRTYILNGYESTFRLLAERARLEESVGIRGSRAEPLDETLSHVVS